MKYYGQTKRLSSMRFFQPGVVAMCIAGRPESVAGYLLCEVAPAMIDFALPIAKTSWLADSKTALSMNWR